MPEYAVNLRLEQAQAPSIDSRYHYVGDTQTTVAYFLTLDTVNFGSGYFPHLRKRPGLSGYFTIATALKERFEMMVPCSNWKASSWTIAWAKAQAVFASRIFNSRSRCATASHRKSLSSAKTRSTA